MDNEDLNVLDGTQENVVDSQTQEEVTSVVAEPTNEENSTIETVEETASPQQNPEINSQIAAARRRAEQETEAKYTRKIAELEAQQAHYGRVRGALNELGYDGSDEEIADLIVAQSRQISPEQAKFEREEEERRIHEAAQNHPDVINARKQQEANAMTMMQFDLAEIHKMNPAINSIEDLETISEKEYFDFLVFSKGMRLHEAYKKVNEKAAAVPQKPKPNTKEHLQTVGGSTSGTYDEVPSDVAAQYRIFNPKATDKQIREHYKKSHGGK